MGHLATRIVHVEPTVPRAQARNAATRFASLDAASAYGRAAHAPPALDAAGFAACFAVAWPELRRWLAVDRPGIAVAVVDVATRRACGSMFLAAKVGEPSVTILGRHSGCDLYLSSDESLSLRQLALIVPPLSAVPGASRPAVSLRVLDLRTPTGFTDEEGRRLSSITAEGSAALRVGSFVVFVLESGDGMPWPTDAASAWASLPERVFVEEAIASDHAPRTRSPRVAAAARPLARGSSTIRAHLPVAVANPDLSSADDPAVASLEVTSSAGTCVLSLGDAALRRGVLLGRYDRCDTYGSPVLGDHQISRVHALLLRLGNATYVFDTASTNGIAAGDTLEPVLRLEACTTFTFGDDLATLTWTALGSRVAPSTW